MRLIHFVRGHNRLGLPVDLEKRVHSLNLKYFAESEQSQARKPWLQSLCDVSGVRTVIAQTIPSELSETDGLSGREYWRPSSTGWIGGLRDGILVLIEPEGYDCDGLSG